MSAQPPVLYAYSGCRMLKRITQGLNRILLAISMTMLILMMLLISIDVIMRYIFNAPVQGSFELTEYLMAVLIPFSIAYCAEQKSHVAVDLVYERLKKPLQNALDIFTAVLSIALTTLLVWQSYRYIFEVKASGLTSSVLLIPSYPFVAPTCIGMAVFALVLIVQLSEISKTTRKVDIGELVEFKKSEENKG